jgi:hypothetical protein
MVNLSHDGRNRISPKANAENPKVVLRRKIKNQALLLAKDNRQADPSITKVFWFPADDEVRLLELTPKIPTSPDGTVHPYRFGPSLRDKLLFPSAIALIRRGEFGQLKLPEGWGTWQEAEELALGR